MGRGRSYHFEESGRLAIEGEDEMNEFVTVCKIFA